MNKYLQIILLLIFQNSAMHCAKILGIFIINSRSHHSINQPILKGLAARGHEVTVISHFKSVSTIPNYTEIQLEVGSESYVDSITVDESAERNGVQHYVRTTSLVETESCFAVFNLDYMQNLINSKSEGIDLLFVEIYHTECYNLLAHKLDVPVIAVSPPAIAAGVDQMMGNPFHPSVVPSLSCEYTTEMSFLQRMINTLQYCLIRLHPYFLLNEKMEEISQKYFNMKMPSEEILHRRVALGFYNNHFSFMAKAQTPNVIDIAGIHIMEIQPLPEDIKEFIESAEHGVILFSFGTAIKASSIHAHKLSIFKQVFSSIPQKVLWRVDELNITDLPLNVKLAKWLPQRDILEHENVVAFISHCGLLGTLEAIYTGTPVVAIPFMFDQYQDANILQERGTAILLDYYSLDKETFSNALAEIVSNKKYTENMRRLSNTFKDRPMSPLDTAIYWSEYVIKHKGAGSLRPQAADMPLYQYLLLDVSLFLLSIVVVFVYFLKYVMKKIVSLLYFKKKG